MKTLLRFYIKVFFILCLASAILLSFPLFEPEKTASVMAKGKGKKKEEAKKKEDDAEKKLKEALKKYEEAQKKFKEGKEKDAIKKLQEAIKKYSQPVQGYYPYLQLGLIYLKLGDFKGAQTYCGQSQKFGVAPKNTINECLAVIAGATKQKQTVQVKPTATPKPAPAPTPTPQPVVIPTPIPEPVVAPAQQPEPVVAPAQQPKPDAPPAIAITSVIPETTEEATLTIAGVATDDQGIADVNVQVRKPGTKAIVARPRTEIEAEKFETVVPLEIGQNEIIVQAIDTSGQVGQRVFPVLRNPPPRPLPSGQKATSPSAPEPLAELPPKRGNVYAVIIGIGNFQDARIPPLRFTVKDAQGFHDVLTDPNFGRVPKEHVRLLLDEDATDRNIKDTIGKWLSRQAKEEDTVIIYYSGHGAPEEGETYWVTYNADIDNLYISALSNNEIHDMLNRVQSKRVITFLDSCYSAATVNRTDRTRDIMTEIPWEKFSGEGRVTISASNGKQLSLEMNTFEHGVFTYYLLEGLRGEADGTAHDSRDGVIEIEELWNYVRNQVSETARQQGNTQTPVLQGSLSAGIPLAFDVAYLKELRQKRLQEKQEKQAKLQALFEQGEIQADHFDCAFQMLEAGQSNGYLDGLLSGEISPKTFSKLFSCEAQ